MVIPSLCHSLALRAVRQESLGFLRSIFKGIPSSKFSALKNQRFRSSLSLLEKHKPNWRYPVGHVARSEEVDFYSAILSWRKPGADNMKEVQQQGPLVFHPEQKLHKTPNPNPNPKMSFKYVYKNLQQSFFYRNNHPPFSGNSSNYWCAIRLLQRKLKTT